MMKRFQKRMRRKLKVKVRENENQKVVLEHILEPSFPQPKEAVALYEYKAGTDKELSFNKGDKLCLFSKV